MKGLGRFVISAVVFSWFTKGAAKLDGAEFWTTIAVGLVGAFAAWEALDR